MSGTGFSALIKRVVKIYVECRGGGMVYTLA